MITQMFFNFLRDLVVDWLSAPAFTALPDAAYDAHAWIAGGGAWLNTQVSAYGAIIPFNTINSLFGVWIGLLAFWVAALVLRSVLWAFNR